MRRILLLAILLLAGACALPRYQPVQEAVQSPRITPTQLQAADGMMLPLDQWLPTNRKPRGVFLALHGFNDYGTAFEMAGEYFAAQGYAVLAYDQRGFGRTHQPGLWGGRENLIRDLASLVSTAAAKYPGVPLYILGDSMGGAVSIVALNEKNFPTQKVAKVVLVAPALWGDGALNPFYRFVLWAAVHQFPEMRVTGRGLKIVASDNTEMLKALGRDPLVIKQTRLDAIYGLVQMMDEAQEEIPKIHKPLLLLYGQHDQVIPAAAIRQALTRMHQPFTFAHYDTGWHMLLRDLQAKRVWKDILFWVEHPEKPLPSGAVLDPKQFIAMHKGHSIHLRRKKWPEVASYDN